MRFWRVAIIAASLAVVLSGTVYAEDPLSPFVGPPALPRLRAGEVLKAALAADDSPSLLPQVDSRQSIEDDVRALKPSVGAELLTILPGTGPAMDTTEGLLALSNSLLAVSTMKGVTYWSVTRGKEMVLFLQSFVVGSPSVLTPMPDPSITSVPSQRDLVTVQEDSSFGRNTYEEHFAAAADHLHVKTENLTPITFLLVPIISAHGFVSHVVVVPSGKDVLFYGLAYLRSNVPLGDRGSRVQSLENRLVAMARWVGTRMSRLEAAPGGQ